jgi:hypothetical protein
MLLQPLRHLSLYPNFRIRSRWGPHSRKEWTPFKKKNQIKTFFNFFKAGPVQRKSISKGEKMSILLLCIKLLQRYFNVTWRFFSSLNSLFSTSFFSYRIFFFYSLSSDFISTFNCTCKFI